MSFTLRTLLAYLDNAPLPADEREPIQRALEQNAAAQELVQRIRTLMAQPRMASPAVETAGWLQANQVAEYLDGTSEFDVTKKYEQSCLKNDTALSEIAALHQILTDWIDQPTYIGDELRQRIYQFAGSWSETSAADDEIQTDRAVGREAIQAAAQLLQVREFDLQQVPPSIVPSPAAASSNTAKNSLPTVIEKAIAPASKSIGDQEASNITPKSKIATSAVNNTSTEESGQGSWILALLVLVGFGVLWWTQQPHSEIAGFAMNPPAADKTKDLPAPQPSTSIPLPSLSESRDSTALANLPAPSATLPPIHLSSGSSQPPLMLGNSSLPLPPAANSNIELPSSPAAEIPTLPTPVLESPLSNSSIATDMIPDLATPETINPPTETTTQTPTPTATPTETTGNPSNVIDIPDAGPGLPSNHSLPPATPANENIVGLPLVNNTPSVEATKPKPSISELPPVDEDPQTNLPAIADSLPSSGSGATIQSNPLVPAGVTPETSTPLTTPLSTPLTTPLAPTPAETGTTVGPEEWGQQIGTVVMEAGAGQTPDDWILVLPGGRSQLKMRSPRGKAWNFTFAGVSRYQLQEKEGLPLLSVQRCFLLMQSTSQDESLEIQTPKGKVFITALTPEAELVFEIRPFLPLGFTATSTAPRYYLGCLGITGRFMIEHQGREEVLYENKWFVVRPDGQFERHEKSASPAILATIQEMKDSQMNPDVTALSELVQSNEGMDELFSIANGTHMHSQQITLDQRSLAALWSYGLGQLDPAFAVLNDPQFKNYWDVHIQAIASCLQSDPAASSQLTTAASRVGLTSAVENRFVGLDPPTVKMSQLNELIGDLEHAQVARRVLALHTLQVLTKETFGYDPSASSDTNRVAIEKWKQWLADSARAKISINPASGLIPK